MNRGRTSQLGKVAERAAADRDQAAGLLRDERQKYAAAKQQLLQLEQFLSEYESDLRSASAAGIGAAQLQEYRRFLVALNEAIEQQSLVLQQSDGAVSAQQQNFQVKNSHCTRMDQLLNGYRLAEQRESAKREQSQQDDRFSTIAQAPASES